MLYDQLKRFDYSGITKREYQHLVDNTITLFRLVEVKFSGSIDTYTDKIKSKVSCCTDGITMIILDYLSSSNMDAKKIDKTLNYMVKCTSDSYIKDWEKDAQDKIRRLFEYFEYHKVKDYVETHGDKMDIDRLDTNYHRLVQYFDELLKSIKTAVSSPKLTIRFPITTLREIMKVVYDEKRDTSNYIVSNSNVDEYLKLHHDYMTLKRKYFPYA